MSSRALGGGDERLRFATVLVELGELYDAEPIVAAVLDGNPEDLGALGLFAKIKHMRGELSEAVACWAQIHTRSPQNETARMYLASMLQLARDPAKGAGEFLALGPFQLWKKPASHLELEEAFTLFLSRRPEEAKTKCDGLARKYQKNERDLYKMAILAKAWISELSGDLPGAAAILNDLGRERGFETDADRILALARLYEQLGQREHLEKAIHIFEYLDRSDEQISVVGRLASLYRALGREAETAEYQQRFLELFRSRMHRPSFEDVIGIATRHYLPLEKLFLIRFDDVGTAGREKKRASSGALGNRPRAIALAFSGNLALAREVLASGKDPLDLRYQADIDVREGRVDRAISLYIDSIGADSVDHEDLRVLEWLLERQAGSPAVQISEYFKRPEVSERAVKLLERALRTAPLRPSLWRHLAMLHRLNDRVEDAARCTARAGVLDEASRRNHKAIGRVLAAAVYHFVGKAKGLIHEIWAGRKPAAGVGRGGQLDDILGNLTSEMTMGVRNTFLSVREYAQARLPHLTPDLFDYNYTYKVTKEDEPSGGLSAGLPTALAFLSVFVNRPVPQDLAASGVLVADSHEVLVVKSVGEPEFKVRGAYNRNLRMLILPSENRRDLATTPLVPPAICDQIVRYVSDLDDAVSLVFGEDIWHS